MEQDNGRVPLPPGFQHLDDFLDKYLSDPEIEKHLPKAREKVRRQLASIRHRPDGEATPAREG